MNNIKELEQALSIDKDAIDESLLQQPDLFYRVSQELALAISRRDSAKQDKEETEAMVDAEIRRKAEQANQKTTESRIAGEKLLHIKVIEDSAVLRSCNNEVNRWSALKEAYIQRSHALRSLVELHISGYFGSITSTTDRMKNNKAEANIKAMAEMRELNHKPILWAGGTPNTNNVIRIKYGPSPDRQSIEMCLEEGDVLIKCFPNNTTKVIGTMLEPGLLNYNYNEKIKTKGLSDE